MNAAIRNKQDVLNLATRAYGQAVNIEWKGLEAENRLEFEFLEIDRAITRKDNTDRVPELFQFRRECAKNVGEAADFGEGHRLPGQHDDVHAVPPYDVSRSPIL